jgi:hypothetical protein
MTRVYAEENATQRGNSGTALAGSIASAIRLIARGVLLGDQDIARILAISEKALDCARGNLTSSKGIGHELIEKLLEGVPKMTTYVVEQQLANLKSSGDYQRIITEVTQEIEQEQKEAVRQLERAEKERAKADAEAKRLTQAAAEARRKAKDKHDREAALRAEADAKLADKRRAEMDAELKKFDALRTTRKAAEEVAGFEPEFDFAGVARHLKGENQIRAFREMALKAGVKPYLPVGGQAKVAAALVRLAKDNRHELSAAFIRNSFVGLLSEAKLQQRSLNRKERAALEAQDIRNRFDRLQDDFRRNLHGMVSSGVEMLQLMASHRNTIFRLRGEIRTLVKSAQKVIDKLAEKL